MALKYNADTNEFEVPEFGWWREVRKNYEWPFLGGTFKFETVTTWKEERGREQIDLGISDKWILVSVTNFTGRENTALIPREFPDKEIAKKVRQQLAILLLFGATNWDVLFEEDLDCSKTKDSEREESNLVIFQQEYTMECPRCWEEGSCVAAASDIKNRRIEWWNYCPNCSLNAGPYDSINDAAYEWRG